MNNNKKTLNILGSCFFSFCFPSSLKLRITTLFFYFISLFPSLAPRANAPHAPSPQTKPITIHPRPTTHILPTYLTYLLFHHG
ncbi:hypothetical protein BDW59DRAFT_38293 [Aspergillus cavernicola]|uniref:Uncharacterized protein n=1 Tax=Aspergillus cavernicola TaxID=176166 RepID=A0ABR4IN84_9EURO